VNNGMLIYSVIGNFNSVNMSILAAFTLALLIALLFAPGYRKGSYGPIVIFFFILFLAGIASQFWIIPIGPVWWGVSWLPLLFVMLLFTFLFAAPSPYERERATKVNGEQAAVAVVSVFIWLFVSLLFIAIIIGFLTKSAS
jgi:hypothetical protein